MSFNIESIEKKLFEFSKEVPNVAQESRYLRTIQRAMNLYDEYYENKYQEENDRILQDIGAILDEYEYGI